MHHATQAEQDNPTNMAMPPSPNGEIAKEIDNTFTILTTHPIWPPQLKVMSKGEKTLWEDPHKKDQYMHPYYVKDV